MKLFRFTALFVGAVLFAGVAFAQGSPSSTLTGRVLNEGQGLPGVSVTVKSPTLQGTRTAVTSVNGDFSLPQLPPGDCTVTLTMSGFQTVTRQVKLSAAQTSQLQVTMNMASVAAEAVVVAQSETISQTQQAAQTVTTDTLAKLPSGRTINSAIDLAPGVNFNGPSGQPVISGGMSFENLILVNGVAVQDNVRNTQLGLYVEDAIQEQTVATSGISAEYGRFAGGVVNVITKSGGNVFSGSFRSSLTNDKWTSKTDFIDPATGKNPEVKLDKIVPTYEATFGGPILKDTLWFFGAARLADTDTSRNSAAPVSLPYVETRNQKRFEGKLTFSLGSRHTLLANYQTISDKQGNNSYPNAAGIYDQQSLYDRETPQELISGNYSGTLSDNFFVEAQYSQRKFTFVNSGSKYTDIINGTLMVDRATNIRWWSPTFCGVCDDEKRDANQALVKGTYFLSTKDLGSHNIVLGGELYDDQRFANNYQSGSNYRIYTKSVIVRNGVVYPVIDTAATGSPTSFIRWTPIAEGSQGNSFKTWSVFLNDSWTLNKNLTFNVGVRWDKNDGKDASGVKTVNDSKFSPRLGVVWDVKANGDLLVNASYARYVAAIANNQADAAAVGGQPATIDYDYRGPAINMDSTAPLVTTDEAIRRVFEWFNANGGTTRTTRGNPAIPGLSPEIQGSLKSPNTDEFAIGITKRLGQKGSVRTDLVYRSAADFYAQQLDMTTGRATGGIGGVTKTVDRGFLVNTDVLEREYWGFSLNASYRPLDGLSLQGNWTWSRLRGNIDGETATSGPTSSGVLSYPEYFNNSWSYPIGDLANDRRHKVRLWAIYDLPFNTRWFRSSISLLESYQTGLAYSASGTVDSRPYVANPGYLNPPSSVTYTFGPRGSYKLDDIYSTDIGMSFNFKVAGTLEIFVEPQVLNVFNHQNLDGVNTTVETKATRSTDYAAFNPFTDTPKQGARGTGANWNYGPNFGKPTSPANYQDPTTFRISLGLRF
ncbi:MAG: TonB-dependent receptor [Holophagales bacterium]|nr:TonB-dependent receptor [Holophagales bacterium]